MSTWMNFFGASPHVLPLPCDEQPVEPGADQHDDVGVLQHRRARGAGALRMGVGQQALGHAHGQERHAALLDQGADRIVGLGVGGALAEDDQRALGGLEHVERTLDRGRGGNLRRRGVDHLHQRLGAGIGADHLGEQLGRQVEIDAAGPAGNGCADGAREADADVLRVEDTVGRLAQRLGDGELVHLLVVALLQIDDLALGRARHQDHREAVRGGVGECRQAVQEAGRRNSQTDAGLLGQEARDRRCVAGVLFVTERQHADAGGLRVPAEVGDGNSRHAVDRGQAVQLHRVDDEAEAVRQILRLFHFRLERCLGHWFLPNSLC